MENKKVIDGVKNIVINKRSANMAGLITILLIVLKVTNNIEISWFWVFAPYWLPICIIFGFIGILMGGALFVAVIAALYEEWDNRR
jgi:ABC-type polysaccharide/polyol phosphate export permease